MREMIEMKYECDNCESLTDEKDVVMVLEDNKVLTPYCIKCWKIINCQGK